MSEAATDIMDAVGRAMDSDEAFGDLLTVDQRQFLLDRGVVRSVLPGDVLCEYGQKVIGFIYLFLVKLKSVRRIRDKVLF